MTIIVYSITTFFMIYKVKHWLYLSLCLPLLCGCGRKPINIELPDNKLVFSVQGEAKTYYWNCSLYLSGTSYQGEDNYQVVPSDTYGWGYQFGWVRIFYTTDNTTKIQGLVIEALPNISGTPRTMYVHVGDAEARRDGKLYIFQESQ